MCNVHFLCEFLGAGREEWTKLPDCMRAFIMHAKETLLWHLWISSQKYSFVVKITNVSGFLYVVDIKYIINQNITKIMVSVSKAMQTHSG